MTIGWRETVSCPNCGTTVSTEQPVKAWIRGHTELDSRNACLCIGDSDLWVQRYGTRRTRWSVDRSTQYLMLVEVKTHGRDLDDPQRDLMLIVNDLLRTKTWKDQRAAGLFVTGHLQNVRIVHSYIGKRWVQVHCFGAHLLRLSGSTPLTSDLITWDRKEITQEQLVQLLRFDLSPDSLRPMEHRTHKRSVKAPTLFGDDGEVA